MAEKCEITLDIEGMHCQSCANTIAAVLESKGAENVKVNYAANEATFITDKTEKLSVVLKSIEKAGYKARIQGEKTEAQEKPSYGLEVRLALCIVFTLPIFISMFLPNSPLNNSLVQLLLCLPIFIIGVFYFGKSAWASLLAKSPNMDVLITIGFLAAFIYSLIVMRHFPIPPAHPLYFETCATIITLVLLGNFMEKRAVRQTTSALTELLKLQKLKARKVTLLNGKEELRDTDYRDLKKGDILQVTKGESIPVDGVIIQGAASVNESMISGESIPINKTIDSKVIGGTIVASGHLRMKAEKVGKETVVAHIIDTVKKAQGAAPKIQRIGDKVSAVFVPAVIGIAILTFVVAYLLLHLNMESAVLNTIAVLVIACPCAMGLATPAAVAVSLGMAAKKGILIKGADTMEAIAEIKNIAFDKTGTLTTGAFSLKSINVLGKMTLKEAEDIIFSIEQYSTHPIAQSVFTALKDTAVKINLTDISEEEGIGMKATDDAGHAYQIGSYKIAEKQTNESYHSVYLLKDKKLVAVIDLEDTLREHAKETIEEVKKQDVHVVMLSGDKKEKCSEIAARLGIDEFYAEQLPYQKLDVVSRLAKTLPTAMVGDGINDAPALAMANVGISLGDATKIAMQSAQVVLLGNNGLWQLPNLLFISKITLKIIKQNLFWAFLYNIVAIPLAACGIINPMLAALVMSFSDIIVIGNSLRLKKIL